MQTKQILKSQSHPYIKQPHSLKQGKQQVFVFLPYPT